MPENSTNLEFKISGSVGRPSKGAVNNEDDVETVQDMLRFVAMVEKEPRFDPGAIDGTIDTDESKDDTVKAIEAFQARFMTAPDGVIGVGKRTWKELMTALEGDETDTEPAPVTTPSAPAPEGGQFFFPFKELPKENWTEGMRAFGASRSKGKRAHAGCDLYFPVGTTIHAITSGTVRAEPYEFYQGTDALEIDHGTFVARYGEILKGSASVHKGDHVTAGQPIAKVGKLDSIKNSMLHLELYDKSVEGNLTQKIGPTKTTAAGVPFRRRKDLIDPTPKLNVWKDNLPS
jgi:murein DD-endopeptidase MepM/ murein hydrolase activator NlpD